ncbi:GDP-mannose 4,6-dehydratase [Methylobacterium sp. CM6247]
MTRIVAVTGSSGFVGQWMMRQLDEADAACGVSFFEGGHGDMRDVAQVNDAVARLKPHAIVHLAAIAAPARAKDDIRTAFDVNLLGTLNLAQAILTHSPQTRLVFAGSSEVYGRSFNRSVTAICEDAPLEPTSAYGVTKASADILLGQLSGEGLDVVRMRPFNHTGPGQTDAYVVSSFARQIARIEQGLQQPVMKVGNLLAERDFLDVRDVVRAYVMAAKVEDSTLQGRAINLASGVGIKISEILKILVSLSPAEIVVEQDPARMRPLEIARSVGDPSAALHLLGWSPTIPLRKTLSDVLSYWRDEIARRP